MLVHLADPTTPAGFFGTVRLMVYAVFGSPMQLVRLWWSALADRDTPRRRRRIAALATALQPRLSERARVAQGTFERTLYSRDLGNVPRRMAKLLHRSQPLLMVQARTEQDIVAVLAFAREHRLSVFPRGAASAAFGGSVPTTNGVALDLSAMMEIRAYDPDTPAVRLEPGVRWADLATFLAPRGTQPVTTPSSRFSTVGGWAATGGLGLESYGYGAFGESILGARVVTADGEVHTLEADDPALRDHLGTEGQLGVISELTLRVRPRPAVRRTHLIPVDGAAVALRLVTALGELSRPPTHVVYLDAARVAEENADFADRTGQGALLTPATDVVLIHFDSAEADDRFCGAPPDGVEAVHEHDVAAQFLWSERFFPLKLQRMGPSQLAAEVVLPGERVVKFLKGAGRLARRYGVHAATEAIVARVRPAGGDGERRDEWVTIVSFPCDAARRLDYLHRLLLVQLLVHLGVRRGGRPYGLGIWNTPFAPFARPAVERRRLAQRKRALDPQRRLNPGKFFRVRTRFFGLPGLALRGPLFRLGLHGVRWLSPLHGLLARLLAARPAGPWAVPDAEEQDGARLLGETAARCTFCGACVAACPAYLLTRDELVTGRAKLALHATRARGEAVSEQEAARIFQCLDCGLCEEVCQTRLPLTACYHRLEARHVAAHGMPIEIIHAFAEQVDAEREQALRAFGLDLPAWAGSARTADLPRLPRTQEERHE